VIRKRKRSTNRANLHWCSQQEICRPSLGAQGDRPDPPTTGAQAGWPPRVPGTVKCEGVETDVCARTEHTRMEMRCSERRWREDQERTDLTWMSRVSSQRRRPRQRSLTLSMIRTPPVFSLSNAASAQWSRVTPSTRQKSRLLMGIERATFT